jgi:hypothetical protein
VDRDRDRHREGRGVGRRGRHGSFDYRTARGQTGKLSCLTSDAGICDVELVVANRESSVTFTVTSIGSTPLEPAESVTVFKP